MFNVFTINGKKIQNNLNHDSLLEIGFEEVPETSYHIESIKYIRFKKLYSIKNNSDVLYFLRYLDEESTDLQNILILNNISNVLVNTKSMSNLILVLQYFDFMKKIDVEEIKDHKEIFLEFLDINFFEFEIFEQRLTPSQIAQAFPDFYNKIYKFWLDKVFKKWKCPICNEQFYDEKKAFNCCQYDKNIKPGNFKIFTSPLKADEIIIFKK